MNTRRINPWLLILISILVAFVVTRVAVTASENRHKIEQNN
jgi:hypothetical protein